MNNDIIDVIRFKTLLLEHKEKLQEIAATGNAAAETVELDQTKMGRLSRMDALQGQAMSVEANRRREANLIKIDAALRRIEEGEYGFCLNCGEPISVKRLEVDPAAPRCITCAE